MISVLPLMAIALLMTSCATSVPLQSSFWNRKGASVEVALATLPEARAHRVGSEMLLDLAINKGLAQRLDARMHQVGPTMLKSATDSFATVLQQRGFVVRKSDEPISVDSFQEFESPGGPARYFDRDLRPLSVKDSADLLLLITVRRYGTLRKYYGFIPLGSPKALFDVSGQMIDLKTNELLWQTGTPEEKATVDVAGEWSQPPDYPNIVAALEKAIPQSMGLLQRQFFVLAQ